MDRIKIFYSGQLPDIIISGSNDNLNWRKIKETGKKEYTEDVYEEIVDDIKGSFRYVKIDFGTRDEGNILIISEIEVWAK